MAPPKKTSLTFITSSSSSAPSSAPAADPSTTTPTPEQSELDKVKADIKYLNSVGITDPNSNETLKNLTAKQKQLESNLFDNVVPNITK